MEIPQLGTVTFSQPELVIAHRTIKFHSYPYCTGKVLFLVQRHDVAQPDSLLPDGMEPSIMQTSEQIDKTTVDQIDRFENEGGWNPTV